MESIDRLDGDVVGIEHGRGSVSFVTTATSTFAYIGTCEACNRPVRADIPDKGKLTVVSCPDCKGDLAAERLVIVTTDQVCAHDCRIAYGRICRCACSGSNHARIWGMRLRSEELTETQVREQLEALLRYHTKQVESLERLAEKEKKDAEMRSNKFNEWLEEGDNETLVADLLGAEDPRLAAYQKMVGNDEIPPPRELVRAKRILEELSAGVRTSPDF